MAKGKRGREAWVPTPEILKQIEGYAGRFLQEQQIARLVGIRPQGFSEKKKEFPELTEAIDSGRAKAAANIGNALYDVAVGKKNVPALIFLAKSIMGLRDTEPLIQENVTYNVIARGKAHKFDF